MVRKSNQKWEVGSTVKVGFLSLTITKKIPTPKDGLPDAYELISAKGARYEFVPHNGLSRVS